MQVNRKYIRVSEKAPFASFCLSKAPNCSKLRVTDIQEKKNSKLFYATAQNLTLVPKIILLTSFAKVYVPVESIIL